MDDFDPMEPALKSESKPNRRARRTARALGVEESPPHVERPLFVSPKEAAKLIRVSRSKMYELIRAGTIPSRKFGASIRIPFSSLQAMANQACRLPDDKSA